MEGKTRPIYFGKPDGETIKLYQPAFLVGNGINYADGCEMSWEKLLIDILPAGIRPNLSKNDAGENLSFKFNNASASLEFSVNIPGKQKGLKEHFADLSYPEIAELALSKRSPEEYDKESKSEFLSIVSNKIQTCIEEGSHSNSKHEEMVEFAIKHNIPILTTNFDRKFLKTSYFKQNTDTELQWIKNDQNITDEDYQTLRNACFCPESLPENSDIHSEFAIWHIHGVIGRKSYRVCLTSWDYLNSSAKIKEVSRNKKYSDHSKDSTWIDILLDNDLIIMGLGLDSFETDLRALLVERVIKNKVRGYIDKNISDKPKTIYIYRKEAEKDEMPFGKRKLFESLGIICVPMEQDDIYSLDKYLSTK